MGYQIRYRICRSILGAVLLAPLVTAQKDPIAGQNSATPDAKEQATLKLAQGVRKQIVTQPLCGVFDSIHFAIKGNTVILRGKASRPVLKSSIENSVKKVEGVGTVVNEIEVLPVSTNDDRIRAAVYRSIYGYPSLQRYTSNRGGPGGGPSVARMAGGITNDPPIGYHAIHIIVENGNVTLTGVVDSEADSVVAGMRASSVPGVFSVDNDLQIASKS